jgi:DNA-binding NarL/FixJ family response regulator
MIPEESPKPPPITVLTIDDHALLRDGIRLTLADQPDLLLIAEAASGAEGIEQFRLHRPDVTLMDLQMPDMSGIDALRQIRAEFPQARIVVLTTFGGDAKVVRALKSGASGFILKDMLRKELRDTIRSVHAGRRVIPADVAIDVAQHSDSEALSQREVDVLTEVAKGHSNKQIAAKFAVSEETVKGYMKSILPKLGVSDRTLAVVVAIKRGIIDI